MFLNIHIFLNITCWFHTMLLVCMFARLAIGHCTTNWSVLLCGGPPVYLALAFLSCQEFLCRLRPRGFFLIQFGVSVGVILVQLTLGWSGLGEFTDVSSDVTRRHKCSANFLVLWNLQSFLSLLCNVFWVFYTGVFCRCILWDWAWPLCILFDCGFM